LFAARAPLEGDEYYVVPSVYFPFNFDYYYIKNDKQAGTYTYKNRSWSKSK